MPDRRAEPPTGRILADPDGRLLYRGTAAGRGQRRFLRMVPLRLRLPGRNRNARPRIGLLLRIRHAAATKSASPTYSRRKTSNGRWSYWARRSKHITTGIARPAISDTRAGTICAALFLGSRCVRPHPAFRPILYHIGQFSGILGQKVWVAEIVFLLLPSIFTRRNGRIV